ncbi:MAG: glycerol kinase GlpK [Actinobacteria bacterium]|nr:glycerol kinase GlpK [Actinomycetota bacterium]
MSVVVAIDAGTTGVRAIAFDHSGLPVTSSYQEFNQYFPQPGWVEHDAEEIWSAIHAVLSDLGSALQALDQSVAAIGITNQRETVVAWDRTTGRPLQRAIVWQDRRTSDFCAQLESDGALPIVRATTGLVLDPYFSATKAHWIFTEGAVSPDRSVALGTIDSWLVWNLTSGSTHITDATNASRTMLFDIRDGQWSEELCDLFGVPMHVLPEVVPSSHRVALTSTSCPLGAGIPISGIAGDQQAALFGQACFESGMAKNTYGTGSFVLMNMGTTCPKPVDGLLTTVAWSLPDATGTPQLTYAYEGAIFVTGSGVQWLRDELRVIENSSDVTALASTVESTDGVVIVPAFTGLGSPWWDPYARGAILGITRGTTAAHLARAMLESIALQTRDVVEAMTTAGGRRLTALRADGGAASDFVLQLQADHLGVPVHRPVVQETTALGAAYLAGLAEGVWDSVEHISQNWAIDVAIEPCADRSLVDTAHQQWLRAVERSRGWAKFTPEN